LECDYNATPLNPPVNKNSETRKLSVVAHFGVRRQAQRDTALQSGIRSDEAINSDDEESKAVSRLRLATALQGGIRSDEAA
jgi:hypothetical protein